MPANSITTFYNEQLLNVSKSATDHTGFTIVYPNPASQIVTVKLVNSFEEETTIRITDINGKLVFEKAVSSNDQISEIPIHVNNLKNGIYLINIQMGGRQFSKKLIIHN